MGQGDREFLTEIQMLSSYRHKNLVSLVGFCDEGGEKILVYKFVKHGSLDNYLSDTQLSWMQRLQISLGMARGLSYLHNEVGPEHRVVHGDIKSSNILLNENWEAKILDFSLSKVSPSNVKFTSVSTCACGTVGYVDPQYVETEILTKETDVYAVGVVLFEILCGRLAYIERYKDESRFLGHLAQHYHEENRLREIIHPGLMNEMKVDSLDIYTMVAYQCLKKDRRERPNMGWIIEKLEKALEIQACSKAAGVIRFGTWGRQSVGDHWSYELEEGHHLLKITINYGEVIQSLMFTSESGGVINSSTKIGSWAGTDTVSEVNKSCLSKSIALIINSFHKNFSIAITQVSFDGDEEISAIS
ncbi:jacalin-like lectin domain-containing protein [Tanacetum coccineum]